MTNLELILTVIFVWGTIWFMWTVHCKIKQIQKKFIKLVDIVKENIPELAKKKIISLDDVDFPKWYDPDDGDIWNIDKLGNIIIFKDGYLPHKYDENTKTWKSLRETPEFMDLISKH